MATNKTRPARGGRGRGGTWLITFFIAAVAVGLAFSPAGGFKAAVFAQTDFNPAIPPQSVEDIEALEAYRSFDPTVPPQSVEDIEALNAYTRASNAADAYTGGSGVTQGADNPGAKAAAVQEKGAPPKKPKTIGCIALTVLGVPVAFNWDACAANIVYLIMWIFSWILWLAGIILDMSIYYTLNLSDLMSHVPVVDIGWKIFRDLANILFIFILLWIAIGTILGLVSGKTKEMVFHLVIVALLMNFSLFITKAVIDGSNIVALHFYNLIVTPSAGRTGLAALTPNSSFSGAFMEGLRIQTLYDPQTAGGQALRDTGSFTDFAAQVSGVVINMGKVILMGLLGIILMLTAAYVFLVAAILFIIRVVVLMMVMILSPLAFLAFALPAAKEYAEVWRKQLINQSLFAPLYLAISYVVVGTIQSDAFKYGVMSVNRQDTTAAAAATVTSAAAVFGIGPGGAVSTAGFAFVFNFIILIALMLASILVAKKMGAIGVETAVKLGKEARGFVGRQIMRGTYVTAAGGVVGYGAKGVGAVVGRIPGLKNVGDKISGFGEKTMEGAERVQKKIDIAELDKKFGKTPFGRTELGDFIRQKTTGGALFGVKAKFGGEKTVKQAYEESEKLRELREDTRNKDAVKQAADRLRIAEQNERVYERPDIKNFTDKDGKVDEQGFEAAEQAYIEKLKEILRPKRDDFENSSDFDAAEKFYRKIVQQLNLKQPKRADFSTQAEFDAALTAYENRPLERPKSYASTTESKVAQIMYDNIEKQKTIQEKDTEEKRAAVGTAMNFLSPQGFAELGEHDIKELAPLANVKQIDAFMASKEWTMDEKRKMMTQYDEKIAIAAAYQKQADEYEDKMDILNAEIAKRTIERDRYGDIKKTVERDGKRYAVKRDGSEGPEIPEAPEFPSALRKWARNDMTQRGYEIMSLIRPEALKIPALAQVIRYPMIFQNIRYNENVAYPIRNDLTIRKDYKLWRFREDNKHHVPPNTDIERARALKLAREAAQKARNEARKIAGKSATDIENAAREAWEETMVNELPNDTLRMAYLRDWQNDRAANETPRGDFRNQGWWHQILDSSSYLVYAPKDASDIVRAQASILAAYIKDINGVAEMTQENKDAINIWFADRRGRQMPTPKLTGGEVEALGYKNGMVEIVDEHGNKKEVSLQEVRERLSRVVKIGDKIAFASDQAKIGLPTAGIEIGSVIPK